MGAEEEDSVEQAAAARRERLKALRAAKELLSTPDGGEPARETEGVADGGMGPAVQGGAEADGANGSAVADGIRDVMTAEEDSASQAAAARRDRLKDLREAKKLLETPDENSMHVEPKEEDGDDEEEGNMNVKFRNYVPHDKKLQEHKLAPPVLPTFEDPVAANPIPEKIEDPFLNIAPKKPNWDLRRDVQKKLDKLERRTQKAIYELYLEQEKEKQALEENGEAINED